MQGTTLAAGVMASLSVSFLLAQDQPTPNPHWAFAQPQAGKKPAPPPVMHLCIAGCSAGKGGTLAFENGRYADKLAPSSVFTIDTFTPDLVVLHLAREISMAARPSSEASSQRTATVLSMGLSSGPLIPVAA